MWAWFWKSDSKLWGFLWRLIKGCASGGNRTRDYSLESCYANHYTTRHMYQCPKETVLVHMAIIRIFFPNVPIYGEMVSLKYFFSYPENRRICEPGNKLIEYYNIAWAASNLEKSNMSKRVKLKKNFQPPRFFFTHVTIIKNNKYNIESRIFFSKNYLFFLLVTP